MPKPAVPLVEGDEDDLRTHATLPTYSGSWETQAPAGRQAARRRGDGT